MQCASVIIPAMSSETQRITRQWCDAVPHDRLAHLIREVSRAFTRSLTVRLEQHGVPFGHWTFLRVLWESDGITQNELSERAGVMAPTTFIAMKSMESLGYIVRRQLAPNKKNMYVYLSSKGHALKDKLVPLAIEGNNVGVEGISTADVKTTRKVLLYMVENLAKDERLQGTRKKRKPVAAARVFTASKKGPSVAA